MTALIALRVSSKTAAPRRKMSREPSSRGRGREPHERGVRRRPCHWSCLAPRFGAGVRCSVACRALRRAGANTGNPMFKNLLRTKPIAPAGHVAHTGNPLRMNPLSTKPVARAVLVHAGDVFEGSLDGEVGLKRTLTGTRLILLGIGAVIGAGIFVLTGQAAAEYAGPAVMLSF